LLKAAGSSGSDLGKEFIAAALDSTDPETVKEAIQAAGERLDERYLLRLIDFLSKAPFRPQAKSALVQFELGLITILPIYLKRRLIDLEDIRRLPAVLESINSQQTVDLLFAMIERFNPHDLELRLEALRALNAMKRDFPLLKMPTKRIFRHILSEVNAYQATINTLEAQLRLRGTADGEGIQAARNGLLNLLYQRQDGNLDRLFRLLGLRYQPTDIIPIYRGLQAADREEKISALEFLEILLENDLKRLVIPVIERGVRISDPELSGSSHSAEQLTEIQFVNFKRILQGKDLRLKLSVIYVIGQLKEERYLPLLVRQLESPDKRVRDMAKTSFDRVFATVEI
jgi:AAA family ATP:ADP antiporter